MKIMHNINPEQFYTLRQIHKMKIFPASYTVLYNLTSKTEEDAYGTRRVLRTDDECLPSQNHAHPMNKNLLIKVLGKDIIDFIPKFKAIMKKKFQQKTPGRKIQSENMSKYWKSMTQEKLQDRMEKVRRTREMNKREREAIISSY